MSARDVARSVLRRVEQDAAYASLSLAGELEKSRLSPVDRGLATEIVYGVLRHQSRLDRALSAHAPRGIDRLSKPVRVALRVAAYQILFLRIPAHAAVDDAVKAISVVAGQRMGGFGNALLRKLAQQGEAPFSEGLDPLSLLEAKHSMPRWLGQEVLRVLGATEALRFAESVLTPSPVVLRVSLEKTTRVEVVRGLREERPDAEVIPIPSLPEAIFLRGGGAPEALGVFQRGEATVQDGAAQLVGRMCGAQAGERILDACAGVGGKSTHLAQLAVRSGGAAHIDAVDLSQRKSDLAEDAARRLGLQGIQFVVADVLAYVHSHESGEYDRVLLDAPCSGLGTLRRHPEGKWRRSEADVRGSTELQSRMLDAVSRRVRSGGTFVYSVCTFTDEEGPRQVARFLERHSEFFVAPPEDREVDFAPFLQDGFLRTWPHRDDMDAFFAARMIRRS